MKRITAFVMSTAILAASPALAQVFEDWDTDGDGILSESEWSAGFADAGLFDTWNTNDDNVIDATEYQAGLFGWFDDDDDGSLTVSEWDEGVDAWFGEGSADFEVSAWDDDGDGIITREEFNEEYATAGLFEDFTTETGVETVAADTGDATGVREQDFVAGLFDWFDADDDSGIVADEAGWFG